MISCQASAISFEVASAKSLTINLIGKRSVKATQSKE